MVERKKQLYRDTKNGKIAGVCAGIAEYFGWELWVVRIVAVTALVVTQQVAFIAYVVAWFVIDKKEGGKHTSVNPTVREETRFEKRSDGRTIEVKTRVWEAGKPPKQALSDIVNEFRELERDVGSIERYVTSSEYRVKQEISRL
ncbi:MAG: phage shock protein PspC [Idiomarinaceae bacterium HL-53]|nr:MAG: phage shock protein PspC [Idiomarinaceae bacterium HL-53]CUS49099.1 phage shock protein C (PspC) family protein [Idiomarinaceae bacterium HL-53]